MAPAASDCSGSGHTQVADTPTTRALTPLRAAPEFTDVQRVRDPTEPQPPDGLPLTDWEETCIQALLVHKRYRPAAEALGLDTWGLWHVVKRPHVSAVYQAHIRQRLMETELEAGGRAPDMMAKLADVALGEDPAHPQQVYALTAALDRAAPRAARHLSATTEIDPSKGRIKYTVTYDDPS